MKLVINGEAMQINDTVTTVEQLIRSLQLEKKSLIVEHNQAILKKEHHSNTVVSEGDRLEIVHFVGGG
ncbi:sulfur carrier protein ThiS [Gracilibacillus caseinilyticus]|uniref:Sulfur carrier protein ThiS n=1 Tax=Gracilibacillus caseinilyticus TaxID=2932256 RepID=A0ABY4ET43_9BACI|nr:sulfur carrier protein ThiS [Gracilibacillus caseinilyticus]UOQ46814.1 sulfur carrier protein ThiS [Gracilibacillus caseinilyticus]